jgi:hypothetical protein
MKHPLFLALLLAVTGLLALAGCGFLGLGSTPDFTQNQPRPPQTFPDLADVVIPPNICPISITVRETGSRFAVRITAGNDKPVIIQSPRRQVIIPRRTWLRLLEAAKGSQLRWEVAVRSPEGRWSGFLSFVTNVSQDPIDRYLCYRKIHPIYNYWRYIGVYQRDLSNFNEYTVLHGRSFGLGCLNCHSFADNQASTMSLGIRSDQFGAGTLVASGGKLQKLDTKWGYTAWDKTGQLAAFPLIKVQQFFHAVGSEVRDVVDLDSDVFVQRMGSPKALTAPAIADKDRLETYPAWSPDGKSLYFCSAPILWADRSKMPPDRYQDVRYDLRRISFDPATDTFGEAETILSADDTGLSILEPRVSPDGRFLLFCMCQYGCFPIYQPSSDLYMMDLQTRKYGPVSANSDRCESWHSWSSNSRWIAFSSKRNDGIFTRTQLAYVDAEGNVSKAFPLPQQNPDFYNRCLETYTVPEFVKDRVQVSPRALSWVVRNGKKTTIEMPVTSMTPPKKEGAATPAKPAPGETPWTKSPVR